MNEIDYFTTAKLSNKASSFNHYLSSYFNDAQPSTANLGKLETNI